MFLLLDWVEMKDSFSDLRLGDIVLITWTDHAFYQGALEEDNGLVAFNSVGHISKLSPVAIWISMSLDTKNPLVDPYETLVLDKRTITNIEILRTQIV